MSRDSIAKMFRDTDKPTTAQPKKANQLSEQQRTRLFQCISIARHINGATHDKDPFDDDIYATTIALMEPHWLRLEFDQKPSHITICKIWKDFVRTDSVIPIRSTKSKATTNQVVHRQTKGDEKLCTKEDLPKSLLTKYCLWGSLLLCLLMPLLWHLISAQEPINNDLAIKNTNLQHELKVRQHIDNIKHKYPNSLTPKQIKAIRARLEMMKKEVSVLLLLGRSHDLNCKADPTFCIGHAIANVSQYPQFGYIDARDSSLDSNQMIVKLSETLDERNDIMMIDSLDKLPGSEAMKLFQFVDRDEMNKRRKGLLLLLMYTDRNLDDQQVAKLRDAEIVERLLVPKWSKYVRGDTLTSVISRISGTIVKVQ